MGCGGNQKAKVQEDTAESRKINQGGNQQSQQQQHQQTKQQSQQQNLHQQSKQHEKQQQKQQSVKSLKQDNPTQATEPNNPPEEKSILPSTKSLNQQQDKCADIDSVYEFIGKEYVEIVNEIAVYEALDLMK